VNELLRLRDARFYLVGQAASGYADNALWIAAAIWVKTLTGSNTATGLLVLTFAAPQLLTPLAGVLVDRVDRRTVLLAVNLLSAGLVLSLLAVHGRADLWVIYVVMGVLSALSTVASAGGSALMAAMLPPELLPVGNSTLHGTREALRLVAPVTGAGLFAAFGAAPVVLIDSASFLFAVATLVAIATRSTPGAIESSWVAAAIAGTRHVLTTRSMRQIVLAYAMAGVSLGLSESVLYAVVEHGVHRPPAFVGILTTAMGVGGVVGSLLTPTLIRRTDELRAAFAGLLVLTGGFILQMGHYLSVVLLGEALFGLSLPLLTVGVFTLIQRLTPAELQGRAFATSELFTGIPQIVAIATGALLIAVVDYRILLAVMAAITLIAALVLAFGRATTLPVQPQLHPAEPMTDTP
jgi:MFS family permease